MRWELACCEALEGRRLLASGVDLVAVDAVLNRGALTPGLPYEVTFHVTNAGPEPSGGVRMALYLSADAAPGGGDDALLMTANFATVGDTFKDGATIHLGTGSLMRGGVAAGTYYPVIVFEPRVGLEDDDPSNNAAVLPAVTVEAAPTDVEPVLDMTPLTAASGCSFTVYPSVKVTGTLGIGGVAVVLSLSADDVAGNEDDVDLGTYASFDPLEGNTTTALDPTSFLVPEGTPAGTYRLVMSAKPTGYVVETDQANNVLVGPEITVLEPDLGAELVPVIDDAAGGGEAKAAKAMPAVEPGRAARGLLRLSNPGSKAVIRTYRMKLILSADRVCSPDDTVFARRRIRVAVPARGKAAAAFSYAPPKGAAPGARFVIAVADVAGEGGILAVTTRKLTTPHVEAAARVNVVAPRLEARVRALRRGGHWTTLVTVRVKNSGTAAETGQLTRVLTVRRASDSMTLATVRRTMKISPGRFQDVVLRVEGRYADAGSLLASIH